MMKWDDVKVNKIFQQFAELLEERFSKGAYTTEDSLRYTLFYCLTYYSKVHPSEIILEFPHNFISGAEVDAYIPPKDGCCGLVFELKFDREIPSGKNSPKTQKAGKAFADIFRLALFASKEDIRRYFVYVTDREMATYFQNPSNQLDDFFNLVPNKTLRVDKKYISNHPATFIQSVGKNVINCEIACMLNRNIRSEIWLRIYEIKQTNFR